MQIKVPEVEGAISWGPPRHPRLRRTCRRCRDRTCCGPSCCTESSSRLRENGQPWPWFVGEARPEPCGRPPPSGPRRRAWWPRRHEGWFDPITTSWKSCVKKKSLNKIVKFQGWLNLFDCVPSVSTNRRYLHTGSFINDVTTSRERAHKGSSINDVTPFLTSPPSIVTQ